MNFLSKIKYLLLFLFIINSIKINSDNIYLDNILEEKNEILIESNKQRSDLKKSIFYAEGDVIITNIDKEFIAKSKKAIFYKLSGKIKLIGDVEVFTRGLNQIRAGEVMYFVKENEFEAISDINQRVTTKFVLNKNILFKELPD